MTFKYPLAKIKAPSGKWMEHCSYYGSNLECFAVGSSREIWFKIFPAMFDQPLFGVGNGNIVVSDDGFDGAVISTSRLNDIKFRLVSGSSAEVTCLSGTPTARLVSYCTQNCLSGIEKFAGLPGSIGGALFMNARCFDLSISGLLKSAEYIDLKTMSTVHYDFCENDWDYKRSPFQCGGKILTSATFTIEKKHSDELEKIAAECRRYVNERVQKGHFKYPSAGSVFKNNRDFGEPSGKLIDECGLCGKRIGGGAVSVTVTGKMELTKVDISPDVVDPEDVEMLSDLVMAAANEALRAAAKEKEDKMESISGGLNIPGLF